MLSPDTDFTVETRGIIGAEKLHEELVSSEEAKRLWETENHYIIEPIGGRWSPEKKMTKANIETSTPWMQKSLKTPNFRTS